MLPLSAGDQRVWSSGDSISSQNLGFCSRASSSLTRGVKNGRENLSYCFCSGFGGPPTRVHALRNRSGNHKCENDAGSCPLSQAFRPFKPVLMTSCGRPRNSPDIELNSLGMRASSAAWSVEDDLKRTHPRATLRFWIHRSSYWRLQPAS